MEKRDCGESEGGIQYLKHFDFDVQLWLAGLSFRPNM